MAINKTTTETKNKIKANSVIAFPNRPQIPAEQLKQAFVKPIVDTSNSMIQELDRIVEETNVEITDLDNDLQGQINVIDGTLQNHESRIGGLELFADNLETNITEEIEGALANKADLVDGKVPREQLPSFVDDIIEGFYINGQFYSEGEESPEYLITPEFGKLYVDVDTNKMYRALGGTYEEIPSPFELTKAKVEAVLTGDITSHNHATEIGNHNTSETAHSDIRQAITGIQTIIATIDGEADADSVINKLHEIVALLNGYAEGTTLADLLSGKVDKIDGKGLTKNELTDVLVEAYNAAYTHSQSDHAPTNAQANVIEGVQVNGVDLSVANKKVNVTVPTIPDISLNDNQATAGKYISKIEVDATDKHKLNITKENLPTVRPTIELEVASLTTLTEAEKLAIKNTLSSLIVDDKVDGTKFDDIVLVTTNDLIRLHYSSIDYYVANPQITVIFETQSNKYILNVPLEEYGYSTLTSTTTAIPDISTNITTDATSDTKTASPKAVKTYVDSAISTALDDLLGGEY